MKDRFLITTSVKDSWDGNEEKFFLGAWCFNSLAELKKYEKNVLEHCWDDRTSYYNDYIYLKKLNDNILNSFVKSLNTFHNLNLTKKFWEILIGPWIFTFTSLCLNNWNALNLFHKKNQEFNTLFLNYRDYDMILNDMSEAKSLYISDEWNHFIFSKIIFFLKKNNSNLNITIKNKEIIFNKKKFFKISNKDLIKLTLNKLKRNFKFLNNKNTKYLFYNSYINNALLKNITNELKEDSISLNLYDIIDLKKHLLNPVKRKNLKFDLKASNEFEDFLFELLPLQIPTLYIEGFHYLKNTSHNYFNNIKPKYITTGISHYFDDVFKFFCAKNISEGSKIIINQHGGSYGMLKFFQIEDFSISISDYFLTWGWSYKNPKIIPMSASKLKKLKHLVKPNINGGILSVLTGTNKYPLSADSIPCYSKKQSHFYELEQVNFIKNLHPNLQNKITLRVYPNKYSGNDIELFKQNFKNIKFDNYKNMYDTMNQNKLFIGTYNSTTFLEAFFMNYPTVMFWNQDQWELNDGVKKYFKTLIDSKILHYESTSAANHINDVWSNLYSWWYSDEIQNVRISFCNQFAKSSTNDINKWVNFYKNIY